MSCLRSTTALCITPLESAGGLTDLAAPWRNLAGEAPFAGPVWLGSWWKHYQVPLARLLTLAVRDETGAVVGLAPWYVQTHPLWGRVIRFLGDGEVCSDYLTILAQPDRLPEVTARLADWLLSEGARQWDTIELTGVIEGDAGVESLVQQLVKRGARAASWSKENCWRAELPSSWDAYLTGLSKSRRQQCRQIQRRLFDTGRVVRHDVRTPEQIERGWQILMDLHQERRRALGQPGCFASQRFTAFHTEVVRQLFEAQALRLFWIEVDGQPAAAEYSLRAGEGVYYYQGGINPALAEFSPGWLAFISSLSEAIAAGCRWFDFLRGDEPYKASWRAKPRRLMTWRLAAPRPIARIRNSAWYAGRSLKAIARRGAASLRKGQPAGKQPAD